VIQSFRSEETEALFRDLRPSKRVRSFARQAIRRLQQLDSAVRLSDLALPGNRLEKLRGDRTGQFSIRINDQWRVCFRWSGKDAYDAEIVDYH
jgi:toxin HigB-1